ncbi:MBL fold metallo-hydrolase [Bacterioplanoides sp. SCSIO 12839]|uniref:MBL fold metallo-hydrolase n=1 Tax=Bacterioplanoides sp. SCSIO 12839 TaxID=2829569 RepID=UPI0021043568|nr:MBL fold metallo-hydrolase [Bacterioplanoides sp. SCSIO 12839]UTW49002.1 MBL fold metallo-hydrolase [Bacterioplanoides sp. SCSIO 12839]
MYSIRHHGAVSGVTGSCHQLTLDSGGSVLIDCGLFQGAESFDRESEDSGFGQKQIDFDISNVKALLVTHCHIDHVGRIPYLLAAGFNGPIYASRATAELLPQVIEDAIKVGVSRNRQIITSVLRRLKKQLVAVDYNDWQAVMPGLKARFKVAGHILGSAYIELDVFPMQQTAGRQSPDRVMSIREQSKRVIFSGDLGAPYSPLLPAPKSPYRCDELIIESTYGDRMHEGRKLRRKRLKAVVERCLQNKGTVLIPAFSIGRTQELLYELEDIIAQTDRIEGDTLWHHLDVIVDSPLASRFTEHYQRLKHLWDAEARRKVSSGRHPLSFENLLTVNTHQEHTRLVQYLKDSGRPAIVIAASGMCAGGRMQNYLQQLLPDERTDVVFVGYQAKGTPGRDIQRYGPRFSQGKPPGYVVFDQQGGSAEKVDIRAGIYTLSGYSAHADQAGLVNFVKRMRHWPKHIRIVHGDEDAKQQLKSVYLQLYDDHAQDVDVQIPQ